MSGTGNGSIKVEVLSSFSEKINTITNELPNLDAAIEAANNAIERAIAATGGEATQVGKSIVDNCKSVNKVEFDSTVESLNSFLEGTKHISATFINEQAEILKAINSINDSVDGDGGVTQDIM